MRRFVTGVCLTLAAAASVASAKTVFPYKYSQEQLPNGLTLVVIPMDSPGLVSYYTVVRTGSRDEVEPGKSGFAHFFEHMMFRGTKNYPQNEYNRIVTGIGANANAYTTDDYTAYHLNFAKEDLETVIKIESDRFQHLDYAEPAFQTEAGAVYGEYRKGITQPMALLDEKLREVAYDAHTYKHTTIGFEADIKKMPEQYAYSLSFFQRFYRPDNVVIIIAGDVEPAATRRLIEQYYGNWKKGYEPPKITPEPPQKEPRKVEVTYPGQTLPIIDIAYKGEAYDPHNKGFVASVLLGELAFGETSELYKSLVIQKQKVEFLGVGIPINRDMPLFEIVAMVKDPEDIEYVEKEVYRTLETFRTKPVDQQRLQDVKRHARYAFLMQLDAPDRVAGSLARFVALTGSVATIDAFYTAMDEVTQQDIIDAARKYFTPERRTVGVLKGASK